MAKRIKTKAGDRGDGERNSHVKVWFDAEELKRLRIAAATQGVSPGEWTRQLVIREAEKYLEEELRKLSESKAAGKK